MDQRPLLKIYSYKLHCQSGLGTGEQATGKELTLGLLPLGAPPAPKPNTSWPGSEVLGAGGGVRGTPLRPAVLQAQTGGALQLASFRSIYKRKVKVHGHSHAEAPLPPILLPHGGTQPHTRWQSSRLSAPPRPARGSEYKEGMSWVGGGLGSQSRHWGTRADRVGVLGPSQAWTPQCLKPRPLHLRLVLSRS